MAPSFLQMAPHFANFIYILITRGPLGHFDGPSIYKPRVLPVIKCSQWLNDLEVIDSDLLTFAYLISIHLWPLKVSSEIWAVTTFLGSVPVDFLRPKFRVPHTKHDVISILMNKYTYINMYIIKKIISCIFILCWDITALLKLKWKFAGYV